GLARAVAVALGLACGVRAVGDDPRAGPGDALDVLAACGFTGDDDDPVAERRVLDLLDRSIPTTLETRLASGLRVQAELRWGARGAARVTHPA
ncbi:MAG: hypothetical protein ACRELB_10480, partial [Polyangiaceae bacterium]